ncbi:MAG: type II toxin-antitoxin system RelE/ParE family toxin [Acidobacteriaceae bacterium]|nr:type II toxin-antitoxin system RelE/ParE family toxin [Acidobacteriaceae bacterium]
MLVEFVEAFRSIARNPGIGHKRQDLVEDRPILFWPVRDYLIAYHADAKPVQIITIVHGSRDVPAALRFRHI